MASKKPRNEYGLDFSKEPDMEIGAVDIGAMEFPWGCVDVRKGGKKAWADRDTVFVAHVEMTDTGSCGAHFKTRESLLDWLDILDKHSGEMAVLLCERHKLFQRIEPLEKQRERIAKKMFELVKGGDD